MDLFYFLLLCLLACFSDDCLAKDLLCCVAVCTTATELYEIWFILVRGSVKFHCTLSASLGKRFVRNHSKPNTNAQYFD